jgi:hypothetical protein
VWEDPPSRFEGDGPGSLLDLALHTLARRSCTTRIVSLTRDVRGRRDERDGSNEVGLVDSRLRASHRKVKAQVEVEGREDVESD